MDRTYPNDGDGPFCKTCKESCGYTVEFDETDDGLLCNIYSDCCGDEVFQDKECTIPFAVDPGDEDPDLGEWRDDN